MPGPWPADRRPATTTACSRRRRRRHRPRPRPRHPAVGRRRGRPARALPRYVEGFPGVEVAYASKAWCTVGHPPDRRRGGAADRRRLRRRAAHRAGRRRRPGPAHPPRQQQVRGGARPGARGRRRAHRRRLLRRARPARAARRRARHTSSRVAAHHPRHRRAHPRVRAHRPRRREVRLHAVARARRRGAARALDLDHVEVVGIHAHIGSQIFGTDPFIANAEVTLDLLARWRDEHGVTLTELNLGGGMGIRYTHEDHPVEVARYGKAVLETVAERCAALDYPRPRLLVEPGRAIVGPSTVTLYEVGTIKPLPGLTTWVSVDGGMSDNIRPALYDAEHEVALANRAQRRAAARGHRRRQALRVRRPRARARAAARRPRGRRPAGRRRRPGPTPRRWRPTTTGSPPGAVLVRDGQVRELLRARPSTTSCAATSRCDEPPTGPAPPPRPPRPPPPDPLPAARRAARPGGQPRRAVRPARS
jgi:hypothetical protein